MKNERISVLLAEDDTNLGMLLKEFLKTKEFEVTLCENGSIAYDTFVNGQFDICVFDVNMPEKDGFTLAREIKSINSDVPIIFLTARNMQEDVLEGLAIGADDYMTKPFSMEELILRLKAILRRVNKNKLNEEPDLFQLGNLTFCYKKQVLSDGEGDVKLTTKETELLKLLCMNANDILERNYALKHIWTENNYFNARSMDVYITKLRKHLKREPNVKIINVHGKGYKLIV